MRLAENSYVLKMWIHSFKGNIHVVLPIYYEDFYTDRRYKCISVSSNKNLSI